MIALVAVTAKELFRASSCPASVEVWNAFVSLTYKDSARNLQDSMLRLAVGAFWGIALGIPLGLLIGMSRRAPRLRCCCSSRPSATSHGPDPGDLVRLRAVTMTFVIVSRSSSRSCQHRARRTLIHVNMHRAALSLGASKARVVWEVVLPGALPNIMTGLRNGLGFGWRALIAAEIIVGTSGIGFLMFDARRAGSVVEILLGMIILGILWYIVDSWILAPIERATGQRWGMVTR